MLNDLNVPVKEEDFEELLDELDEDGSGEIEFEEFYNCKGGTFLFSSDPDALCLCAMVCCLYMAGFCDSASRQRQRNTMEYAKMLIRKLLFQGLLNMILFVEARNLLLDEQVHRSIQSAMKEFRVAHPPTFLCEAEHCHMAFLTAPQLTQHTVDPATPSFHAEKAKQFNEEQERFLVLEPLFKGAIGRKLKSKRILFNDHLGNLEHRVNAALVAPYRPRLQDAEAKREVQLRNGMIVTGYDAKAGLRPAPRKFNMINQHRAPGKRKDQKSFADMLFELLYIGDDNIDIVVAPEAAAHAEVKFMYSGYASSTVQLMGEFNAWKPEPLFKVDKNCGRCYIIKMLAAGRYRYRYKLETGDIVDPERSKITDIVIDKDGEEKEVVNNIIQVANPKPPVPLVAQGVARATRGALQNKTPGRHVMNSDGVGNEVVVLDRASRAGNCVGSASGNSPIKGDGTVKTEQSAVDSWNDDEV